MQRLSKKHSSKRAFTLVEMVLVIFIIVILASVVGYGVFSLITNAKEAGNSVDDQSNSLKQNIANGEAQLENYYF